MSCEVLAAGLSTTIQDCGRRWVGHLGLGPGGAVDRRALRIANLLAGNSGDAAALEMTLAGPTLRALDDHWVAVYGASVEPRLSGVAAPLGRAFRWRAGEILECGALARGCRAYLSVAGGFTGDPVLGARGAHLAAGLGRPLRVGDGLSIGPPADFDFAASAARTRWSARLDPGLAAEVTCLRFVPSSTWSQLPRELAAGVLSSVYTASASSDRMGLRLDGPTPSDLESSPAAGGSGTSEPVAVGTLQAPPGGGLVALLTEHQTTGGYPRLGEICSADHSRLAQLRPGSRARLAPITWEDSQHLLAASERELARLAVAIRERGAAR